MLYKVYEEYDGHKNILAICKVKTIAQQYANHLRMQLDKWCTDYTTYRYTFYDIEEILEDDDILNIFNKE